LLTDTKDNPTSISIRTVVCHPYAMKPDGLRHSSMYRVPPLVSPFIRVPSLQNHSTSIVLCLLPQTTFMYGAGGADVGVGQSRTGRPHSDHSCLPFLCSPPLSEQTSCLSSASCFPTGQRLQTKPLVGSHWLCPLPACHPPFMWSHSQRHWLVILQPNVAPGLCRPLPHEVEHFCIPSSDKQAGFFPGIWLFPFLGPGFMKAEMLLPQPAL
jgi:hypothetical protein